MGRFLRPWPPPLPAHRVVGRSTPRLQPHFAISAASVSCNCKATHAPVYSWVSTPWPSGILQNSALASTGLEPATLTFQHMLTAPCSRQLSYKAIYSPRLRGYVVSLSALLTGRSAWHRLELCTLSLLCGVKASPGRLPPLLCNVAPHTSAVSSQALFMFRLVGKIGFEPIAFLVRHGFTVRFLHHLDTCPCVW